MADGPGEITFDDGEIFRGEFKNNRPVDGANCRFEFPDCEIYDGQFSSQKYNGIGQLTYCSG